MVANEKGDAMRKILNIDKRFLYIIVIIIIALTLLRPLGLPIPIDENTRVFYNTIESLPPGSNILLIADTDPGTWSELGPFFIDIMGHLCSKQGLRFIIVTFEKAESQAAIDLMGLPKVNKGEKKYGVDWVFIGFIQGQQTAMSSFASNFLYSEKDAYGNKLNDFPLMNEMKTIEDVDLVLGIVGSAISITQMFSVPYNKPSIAAYQAMQVPEALSLQKIGALQAWVAGSTGAAQYELLIHMPGMAIPMQDALSLSHIFLVTLIVVVNIIYIRMNGGLR